MDEVDQSNPMGEGGALSTLPPPHYEGDHASVVPEVSLTATDTAAQEAIAIQRALDDQLAERKKSKMQRMLERRKARDEEEARRREMLAFYELSIIAASMELLNVTKSFFDLLEILPREAGHFGRPPRAAVVAAVAAEKHRVVETTMGANALEGSASDGDVGQDFPPADAPSQLLREAQSSAVYTHSFLLHTVESFFGRLGLLLHRRVGVGGVLLVSQQRYRAALVDVCAELPNDVVAILNGFLNFIVVPPPMHADKAPFDVTTDDDVWASVSRSTLEWLDLMHVDETLFDRQDYRRLLGRLGGCFTLQRIGRTMKEVARDLFCVLNASDMSGNLLKVDDGHATPKLASRSHHASATALRSNASTHNRQVAELVAKAHQKELQSPQHRPAVVSGKALHLCSRCDLPSGLKHASRAALPHGEVHQPSNAAAVTVSGKFLDPPLSLSAYSKLAPAQWLRQQRDTEALLGASRLHFGCEIGEPPIASTQCRTVLEAKQSHYLYTARCIPTPAATGGSTSTDSGTTEHNVVSLNDRRRPTEECGVVSATPLTIREKNASVASSSGLEASPSASLHLLKARCLKDAVGSRLTTGGRVRADAAAHRVLPPLTAAEQLHLMASLPTGAQLMLAKERATVVAGGKCSKRPPIAVVSRGCLPLQKHDDANGPYSAQRDGSPHCNNVHVCLPRDAVARVLSQTPDGTHSLSAALHHRQRNLTSSPPNNSSNTEEGTASTIDEQAGVGTTLRDVLATAALEKQTHSNVCRDIVCGDGNRGAASPTHKKTKNTVRYATLLSLRGKDKRLASETLAAYWERLQAVAFKLNVLRSAGKASEGEQQLWDALWLSCNNRIDEVFQELKHMAKADVPLPSTDGGVNRNNDGSDDDDSALRCMISWVADCAMAGALKTRRHQQECNDAPLPVDTASHARGGVHQESSSASRLGHFATPVQRTVRVSALEQRFLEHGAKCLFSKGAKGGGASKCE